MPELDLAELAAKIAPLLNGTIKLPGERIVELILEIVLEAMKGQTVEQKNKIWEIYIRDLEWWRKLLKIDA